MSRKTKAEAEVLEVPKSDPYAELEAAANAIIDAMPTDITQKVLREAAVSQHIPLWMLVCGLLQRAYDNGEYSAPVLDPLWLHSTPVTMGEYAEVTCSVCAQTFRPRWPGQEYCSDKCGTAAYRSRIVADREITQPQLATYKIGEEPEGVPRSVIHAYEDGRADEVGDSPDELGDFSPGEIDPIAQIEADAKAALGR